MRAKNTASQNARQRISANLKRYRAKLHLSQEHIAELAGFHRTYISQLERCTTNISIDGLERLANALSVDVSALLETAQETERNLKEKKG